MTSETKFQADEPTRGTTTVAPGVLATLARRTALEIPGVAGLAPIPSGVNRLIHRGSGEGVRVAVEGDHVEVDLHLILAQGTNVREVSRKVQQEVSLAIEDAIGLRVARIDVHIEDIAYADPSA